MAKRKLNSTNCPVENQYIRVIRPVQGETREDGSTEWTREYVWRRCHKWRARIILDLSRSIKEVSDYLWVHPEDVAFIRAEYGSRPQEQFAIDRLIAEKLGIAALEEKQNRDNIEREKWGFKDYYDALFGSYDECPLGQNGPEHKTTHFTCQNRIMEQVDSPVQYISNYEQYDGP